MFKWSMNKYLLVLLWFISLFICEEEKNYWMKIFLKLFFMDGVGFGYRVKLMIR